MASWERKGRAGTRVDAVGDCPATDRTAWGMSSVETARNCSKPSEGAGGLALTNGPCELQSVFITKFWGKFICRSSTWSSQLWYGPQKEASGPTEHLITKL